jgi:hypothetical protein
MFELPPVTWSVTARTGSAQLLTEAMATFGLLGVVVAVGRTRAAVVPLALAAYIVAAYWFTSSTFVRQPRGDDRARIQQDVRRDPSG